MYQDQWMKKAVPQSFWVEVLHDRTGRVTSKVEHWPDSSDNYNFTYDDKGHLTKVVKNDALAEAYVYNALGQRVADSVRGIAYFYNAQGQLVACGDARMEYDAQGRLTWCWQAANQQGSGAGGEESCRGTRFIWDASHRLVSVVLPGGQRRVYTYNDTSLMPSEIHHEGDLLWSWQWDDEQAPRRCTNHQQNLRFTWFYEGSAKPLPSHVYIEGELIRQLKIAGGSWGSDRDYFQLALDQVGSFRALINGRGEIVKRVEYDSFGNALVDTQPELCIPLGFGGGFADEATGLVKFGCRWYDPATGRFISKDPARDRRGDGDVYDYCADDPVGRVDRDGKYFIPLLAGKSVAMALGLSGSWLAALCADFVQSFRTEKKSTAAGNALHAVTPDIMKAAMGAYAGALVPAYAPGAASALHGAALSAWARPDWLQVGLDAALGAFDINMPPPNSPVGYTTGIISNYDKLFEGWGVLKHGIKSSFSSSHSEGGKCTPETQPRDAQGRFSPCSHP